MRNNMQVREDIAALELRLSDESLELMQEYNKRIEANISAHYFFHSSDVFFSCVSYKNLNKFL